jgi:hypothetical protein
LKTPLGTIANYASILEYPGDAKPDDVKTYASRIRSSAVRAAAMLQHVTEAIVLSERPPRNDDVDPNGLLRSLLSELMIDWRFPARAQEPVGRTQFDRDLLAFAWKAFLAVNLEAAPSKALDLDIGVEQTPTETFVDLYLGERSSSRSEYVDPVRFAGLAPASVHLESCFALDLAEELIRLRGCTFGLSGRPGEGASLRIGARRET